MSNSDQNGPYDDLAETLRNRPNPVLIPQRPTDRQSHDGSQDQPDDEPSELPHRTETYEDKLSDSVAFLSNLLDDDDSTIAGLEVLDLLTVFRNREGSLPFSYRHSPNLTVQGLRLPRVLAMKFYRERLRLGPSSWCTSSVDSRVSAHRDLSLQLAGGKVDFFDYHRFYPRLKNHLALPTLRSLVVCGESVENGIFYPTLHSRAQNATPIGGELIDDLDVSEATAKIIRLMPDDTSVAGMKLDCVCDLQQVHGALYNKISSMACSSSILAAGTAEGKVLIHNVANPNVTKLVYRGVLGCRAPVNHLRITDENVFLSNKATLISFDINKNVRRLYRFPFETKVFEINPFNTSEVLVTGDSATCCIVDTRDEPKISSLLRGHKDYVSSCSWSPQDANLLLSGGQDGTLRLWDRRNPAQNLVCWNGAAGSAVYQIDPEVLGGPVRNCMFSPSGNHIVWAETLDHVGIVSTSDMQNLSGPTSPRIQSIDFIGKCVGLDMCRAGSGRDENLVIGVNDCPLGGILTYKLDAADKPIAFDFSF